MLAARQTCAHDLIEVKIQGDALSPSPVLRLPLLADWQEKADANNTPRPNGQRSILLHGFLFLSMTGAVVCSTFPSQPHLNCQAHQQMTAPLWVFPGQMHVKMLFSVWYEKVLWIILISIIGRNHGEGTGGSRPPPHSSEKQQFVSLNDLYQWKHIILSYILMHSIHLKMQPPPPSPPICLKVVWSTCTSHTLLCLWECWWCRLTKVGSYQKKCYFSLVTKV